MAFRSVPEHPKFARLKRSLKLGRFQALGLLESLWHFTAKFCPAGDIGRFEDADIEDWIEWDGEPGAAVKALVDAKWIDPDKDCRLYVHDWHEFADDTTDNALARSGKRYANGKAPRMKRLSKDERALRVLRYAELCGSVPTESHISAHGVALPVTSNQKPEPVPEPGGAHPVVEPSMVASGVLTELCLSGSELLRNVTDVCSSEMKAGRDPTDLRDAMVKSFRDFREAKPRLQFAPGAAKFFGEGHWNNPAGWPWKEGFAPPPPKPKRKYINGDAA